MSTHTRQLELAAARNSKPRRARQWSAEQLAAKAKLEATMARWKEERMFPQGVLDRMDAQKVEQEQGR